MPVHVQLMPFRDFVPDLRPATIPSSMTIPLSALSFLEEDQN